MLSPKQRYEKRKIRSKRKLFGTAEKPRLYVQRTLKHMYAQLIDDLSGKTLLSVGTTKKSITEQVKNGNIKGAVLLGKELAKMALEKGVKEVVFDRSGRVYHGRVKALADGAREGGLKF